MKDYKDYCEWCHQADGFSCPKLASTSLPSRSILCALCSRAIALIDIRLACEIARKNRKTIYQWIRTERIKTVLFANGRCLICYSSLFLPADENSD